MGDVVACGRYFQRKVSEWTSTDGSVRAHLKRVGKPGLVREFQHDAGFAVVRDYLHGLETAQYVHDPLYTELRHQIQRAIGAGFSSRGSPGTDLRTMLDCALTASGITPTGQRLVRVVGALPR